MANASPATAGGLPAVPAVALLTDEDEDLLATLADLDINTTLETRAADGRLVGLPEAEARDRANNLLALLGRVRSEAEKHDADYRRYVQQLQLRQQHRAGVYARQITWLEQQLHALKQWIPDSHGKKSVSLLNGDLGYRLKNKGGAFFVEDADAFVAALEGAGNAEATTLLEACTTKITKVIAADTKAALARLQKMQALEIGEDGSVALLLNPGPEDRDQSAEPVAVALKGIRHEKECANFYATPAK